MNGQVNTRSHWFDIHPLKSGHFVSEAKQVFVSILKKLLKGIPEIQPKIMPPAMAVLTFTFRAS